MYACMYVCMHACMDVFMYACMYACMYVGRYVCMHAYMYVCIHICMYLYIYIFIDRSPRVGYDAFTNIFLSEPASRTSAHATAVMTNAGLIMVFRGAGDLVGSYNKGPK